MKRDARVYLADVESMAGEVEDFVSGTDLEGYLDNRMMQRAVERNLSLVGEALNKLRKVSPETAKRLPKVKGTVGLRNVLVHVYHKVDQERLWNVALPALSELRRAAQSLLVELDREIPMPDRRLADDVLALSCAVSERVPADDPVHRDSLPLDIQEVLLSSAPATHVREEEVARIASGIALKRAETDLRVAATREIGIGEIFEVRARFNGTPDYPEQSNIDAYESALAKGAAGMQLEKPRPTELERRVAKAVLASRGKSAQQGLALAMVAALELGTPATADEIRKERAALLSELQDWPKSMDSSQERSLLRRIYRSFTGSEVRELSQGRGAFLEGLRDDTARAQTVQAVQRLHQKSWPTEPSPWRARHETLVRSSGAERGGGRERGRHRGRGAERHE